MFKSREEREYDAEIDALAREKELVRAEAASLAAEKRHRRYERTDMPLGYWMGWKIIQDTRGSARLDLVRPRFPAVEPGNLFRQIAPTIPQGVASLGLGSRRPQPYNNNPYDQPRPMLGFGQGARIKVMRHIDFGVPNRFRRQQDLERRLQLEGRELDRKGFLGEQDRPLLHREPDLGNAVHTIGEALKQNLKPPEKPWFDFGAGINLELDEGSLAPTMRLKVKDFFSIKVLPEPMFKIQKRLRFGRSSMGVRVNYELPLADARNLWAPPARLMIRLDNSAGGLRVGPGGADFDEHVLQLGDSTSVRAALSLDFPKTLPLEEGERFFGWRARRLGIKTRW